MEKKEYFSIGKAARLVNTTTETLRHYDRIGLVRPSKTDEWTNYRYYTKEDIVRLNTVHALQLMDLPLKDIKKVLDYDNLEEIIEFLKQAERKADEKIAALRYSKKKIQRAKEDYESKLRFRQNESGISIREISSRVILLSDKLEKPTVDNLWNYHKNYYDMIPPDARKQFAFEDTAGIYKDGNITRLFALCTRYEEIEGLKTLPEGKYLSANCTEEKREETLKALLAMAKEEYGTEPSFSLEFIIIAGILHWNYEIQVYIG